MLRYIKQKLRKTPFVRVALGLACISVLLSGCATPPPPTLPIEPNASPLLIGTLAVDQLLSQNKYMMYKIEDDKVFHYAEAAAAYGALKFMRLVQDRDYKQALVDRYQQPPGTDLLLDQQHVHFSVYGALPLQLFLLTGDSKKLNEGLRYADAQWWEPLENGLSKQARYSIDDVWMTNVLQVQAYRATQNPVYLNRAALQTEVYLQKLQQDNGLFYHGEHAPFYWGRGNGWVAAGLAELLSELPVEHEKYSVLVKGYKKMMASLLEYQAESGMWRQLVDKPSSWEESSATAMFGFAMVIGVKKGILDELTYRPAYLRAWNALSSHVDSDGNLAEVCMGTSQRKELNYYMNRARKAGDFHGQAPLLWFAAALL